MSESTTKHARVRTGRKADVWQYFKKCVNIHILVQQFACAIPQAYCPRNSKYAGIINMQAQVNLYWVSRTKIKVRSMAVNFTERQEIFMRCEG